jgi:hypothetical protein
MATGINDLLEKIEKAEKKVRQRYPKQEGRVILANLKQKIDYSFKEDEPNSMEWASRYFNELENCL